MALFSWITSLNSDALSDTLEHPLRQLGLVVDPLVSSDSQLLAKDDPSLPIPLAQRVTVVASWNCQRSRECQLEVRSSEPQLRQGTRCQQIAEQLQAQACLL
jgi:hypothetical protein